MSKRDYYEILGVTKTATETEIKKAYRNLARTYHPDVNKTPEAEQQFKELSEANEILSDPEKRSRYDQFGHAGVNPQYGGGYGGFEDFGGLGDIFEAFFGGGRRGGGGRGRPSGPERGSDLRLDFEISFMEGIFGIEKEVDIQHLENCETCHGNGATPGTKIVTCTTCGGMGQVQQSQRTLFGSFTQVTTCPKCQGAGKWPEDPCKTCSGRGKVKKAKKIKLKIPAGVDTGAKMRVPGEGDIGERGGGPGDLYVVLHVLADENKQFERRGNDIYIEIPLGYHQVALGDEVDVPTLEGSTKLDIPAGTQPGKIFTLKGKGVPVLGTEGRRRGDLYVMVNIAVPRKLGPEESKLLKDLASLYREEPEKKKVKNTENKDDNSFINVLKNALHRDK
jgi:molecular chaperone DnaJ